MARSGPEAVNVLVETLRDPDPVVRAGCSRILGRLGRDAGSALSALRALLRDPAQEARFEAAVALLKLRKAGGDGHEPVAVLAELCTGGSDSIRRKARAVLVGRGVR